MAHIQRLYDFQAGTKIISGQVDAEFNQLISYVNGLDDTNGVLAGATGATKVGVGEGGDLQTLLDELVRFATANIKHIRLNEDKVIETSANGVDWEASGSSGHLIQRANGTILPQRSRLQFTNTTITDDEANNRTVIQGIPGPTGPQGVQGPQGNQGIQGPLGPAIIPSVDQTSGIMSFSEGGPGVIPSPVNVRGPQGAQGVQGEQGSVGPAGPQGIPGPAGPQGIQGPAGPQGTAGVPGPQGPQGIQGAQGIQGPAGVQGPKGDTGAVGPEGPQGARGLKGETGDTGSRGPQGSQGPQGIQGAQGPMGPQGPKGDDGADGTSFAILGVYPTLLALQTAHSVGEAGDAWFVGSTAPYSVYNWDINVSQWVNVGQLEGPQGPQGIQGIQGAQGIQGETGERGPKGDTGEKGDKGDIGPGYYPQGAWVEEAEYVRDDTQIDVVEYNGSSYFCKVSHGSSEANEPPHPTYWGLLAEKGDQGIQGIQGEQGIQGIQGLQGVQGEQGNPGPGLPAGGSVGQIPVKASATDYHTTWTTPTKTMVGLGDVDNTADASKEVLSATKLKTARTIQGKSFDGTADITLDNATTSAAGLMSAADKTRLDGLSNYDDTAIRALLTDHKGEGVGTSAGVHGLRWYDDKLQFYNGSEWIETGSGYTDEEILSPTTAALYGLTSAAVPDDVLAKLAGGVQIATGSYTGTGTYGSSNKNTLTFGFVPKLIVVRIDASGGNYANNTLILMHDSVYAGYYESSVAIPVTLEWSGNSASWYHASSASYQFNATSRAYYYLAIG